MRIAMLLCLTLAFTVSTPVRAQAVPTSPCAICCLAGLYCCVGVPPSATEGMEWVRSFLPVSDDASNVTVTSDDAEAPLPRTPGLRAMAF